MALYDRFHDWLKKRIDGFAMRDFIHQIDNGQREIWL